MKKPLFIPGEAEHLFLGMFPQGPNGELRPIEWLAKDTVDGDRFLISKDILSIKQYYGREVSNWLKTEFAKCLPAELNIKAIRCPKAREIREFFPSDGSYPERDNRPCHNRQSAMSEYAKRQIPGWEFKMFDRCSDGRPSKFYWLSETGCRGTLGVNRDGSIEKEGVHPLDYGGVRPCMIIAK